MPTHRDIVDLRVVLIDKPVHNKLSRGYPASQGPASIDVAAESAVVVSAIEVQELAEEFIVGLGEEQVIQAEQDARDVRGGTDKVVAVPY